MLFSRQFIFFCCIYLIQVATVQAEDENSNTTDFIQCPVPNFKQIAQDIPDVTNDDIKIISKYSTIEQDQLAHFSGGVTLIDKTQKIVADELSFNRLLMQIDALGSIHYQNSSINIFASKLNASKKTNLQQC